MEDTPFPLPCFLLFSPPFRLPLFPVSHSIPLFSPPQWKNLVQKDQNEPKIKILKTGPKSVLLLCCTVLWHPLLSMDSCNVLVILAFEQRLKLIYHFSLNLSATLFVKLRTVSIHLRRWVFFHVDTVYLLFAFTFKLNQFSI